MPLYNEEHSIKDVINRIPKYRKFEIIVVDDGSTDNSVKKIKEIDRKIKLIKHKTNQGYGASILTGLEHATGDIIVTMDSDGQHNPEGISDLIKPILNRQADMVIGSRYLGKSNYKVPLHTRVGEFVINKCLWLLFSQKVANNQSGFRAFTKESLKLFNNMRYTKFGLCTETIFKAACNKLRIIETPIIVNPRKHGCSYVRLIMLIKSIVSCISIYSLEKFGFKKLALGSFFNSKNLSLQNNKVQSIISNESISMNEPLPMDEPLSIDRPLDINEPLTMNEPPIMTNSSVLNEFASITINKSKQATKSIFKTSIIFPSYNGEKFLKRNLDSIKNLTNLAEIELVIIDNNSSDSSIEIIESYKNIVNINLIKKKSNLGFAKACNIGALNAKGEYLFITNQDVIFPPDFFQKLYPIYNTYNHSCEIVVSPAFVFEGPEKRIHYYGAKNHILGFSYTKELGEQLPEVSRVKPTQRCSGGTFFIKRNVFHNMGGFDTSMFMYYEDTDFSLRFLRNGYKIFTTNNPYLIHQKHNQTLSNFRYYLLERNRYITFFKNIDNFKKLIPYFIISEIILIFQSIIVRKFRLRVRMYYELFAKRKFLRKIRKKAKKEVALLPYQKLSRILDPVLIENAKTRTIGFRFLSLFNIILKRI